MYFWNFSFWEQIYVMKREVFLAQTPTPRENFAPSAGKHSHKNWGAQRTSELSTQ